VWVGRVRAYICGGCGRWVRCNDLVLVTPAFDGVACARPLRSCRVEAVKLNATWSGKTRLFTHYPVARAGTARLTPSEVEFGEFGCCQIAYTLALFAHLQ